MLVELRLDEAESQAGRPDLRHVHLAHEVRQGADVVLVPVREHDCPDLALTLAQVLEVGQNEVDAEVLVAREGEAGVDDDDPVVALHHRHVLPDLAQAAERNDARALGHARKCTFSRVSGSEARPALLGAIGQTPVVQLRRLAGPESGEIWLKLESANPTGSYKDRMALAMIEGGERSGRLQPGQAVVEYTGGSTGSSLAFVCAVKGYPLKIVTSDAFAPEKLQTMEAFGAELERHPEPRRHHRRSDPAHDGARGRDRRRRSTAMPPTSSTTRT